MRKLRVLLIGIFAMMILSIGSCAITATPQDVYYDDLYETSYLYDSDITIIINNGIPHFYGDVIAYYFYDGYYYYPRYYNNRYFFYDYISSIVNTSNDSTKNKTPICEASHVLMSRMYSG